MRDIGDQCTPTAFGFVLDSRRLARSVGEVQDHHEVKCPTDLEYLPARAMAVIFDSRMYDFRPIASNSAWAWRSAFGSAALLVLPSISKPMFPAVASSPDALR